MTGQPEGTSAQPAGWDRPETPFHEGELAIQARLGVLEKIDRQARRAIRRFMPDQHRAFYAQLAYVILGTVDESGQPWASIAAGYPGFLQTPDPVTLQIAARPLFGDPLNRTLREGAPIAGLGIELPTRRRNRVSGTVINAHTDGLTVAVMQTFGLCPQYVQSRAHRFERPPMDIQPRPLYRAPALGEAERALIAATDTYFVASANLKPDAGLGWGLDVSHRGGKPGFVRIDSSTMLTAPEFAGNRRFNTLGNFAADNRAGLLFVDFAAGSVLYIAAHAGVIWDGPEVKAFAGAERLVRYHISEVIRVEENLPIRFGAPDYSPLLGRTGSWHDTGAA